MAQALMTPGVYIEEKNAFPGSVVEVATAVPAFIGYTEKAERKGRSLLNKPTRITSFADYLLLFGGAFEPKFNIVEKSVDPENPDQHLITINKEEKAVTYNDNNELYMFRSIKFFYANGGGVCYIVSVGTYEDSESLEVRKDQLLGISMTEDDKPIEGGLKSLLKEQEPTMIVVPDAVKLSADECYDVYAQVLSHCADMQSRVGIFDVHGGTEDRIEGTAEEGDVITIFREKIGTENLKYGAGYYPWLNTSIVAKGEITFKNIDSATDLGSLLPKGEKDAKKMLSEFSNDPKEAIKELKENKEADYHKALAKDVDTLEVPVEPKIPAKPKEVIKAEDNSNQAEFEAYEAELAKHTGPDGEYFKALAEYDTKKAAFDQALSTFETDELDEQYDEDKLDNLKALVDKYIANKERNHHLGLVAASPTYSIILEKLTEIENLLPPSAAMAGIYTSVDNNRGVWKAPANVSVNSVIKPATNITHDDQKGINVDALSGKSINAIRSFPGIGTLVWGGRTLDGNSLDWRYVNVRRTMIMLEQSIKLALRAYVFEPNDANTWVTVRSMVVNFLTDKWKQGALAGASPEDAFDVQIGLGNTMTAVDILEGRMLMTVKLAIVRPAEFIVVTFEQQMQKS